MEETIKLLSELRILPMDEALLKLDAALEESLRDGYGQGWDEGIEQGYEDAEELSWALKEATEDY